MSARATSATASADTFCAGQCLCTNKNSRKSFLIEEDYDYDGDDEDDDGDDEDDIEDRNASSSLGGFESK